MSNKIVFNLNDFNFKIVKCFISSSDNEFEYYLLVDEFGLIHDYKVKFNKIGIKTITTASHEHSNRFDLTVRKKLINLLKLNHSYQTKDNYNARKQIYHFDSTQINGFKINEWSMKEVDWRYLTFQQVPYLVNGSNTSGEGSGRSQLKIKYNNNYFPFGFFFQSINNIKYFNKKYTNINYNSIWTSFYNKEIEPIEFSVWLGNQRELKILFEKYKFDPSNWKNIKNNFKSDVNNILKKYNDINDIVFNKRSEYSKNIDNQYKKEGANGYSDIANIMRDFYGIELEYTNFEKAHIKPVWYIKQEYINKNDKKILDQISDINNFLPLPANVHSLYDKYYFYWDLKGELKIINNLTKNNEVKDFTTLSQETVLKSQKYLSDYLKVLRYKQFIS